jgi:hypothetical protein
MVLKEQEIVLDITGLGIIFYSPANVPFIAEGEDYYTTHYASSAGVVPLLLVGTLVGFGTGSPGCFLLRMHSGYPDDFKINQSDFSLRLALHCSGGCVCFRDVYDLREWVSDLPPNQTVALADGYYHVTVCSDMPESGRLGDNQIIDIYFASINDLPILRWEAIPMLCN